MNGWSRTALALLLAVSLSGCAAPRASGPVGIPPDPPAATVREGAASETAETGSLLRSYYEGQDSRAFQMLHKRIFSQLLGQWTDAAGFAAADPVWVFDSFTRYDILDPELQSIATHEEVYCCGFSSPDGGCGYFVLSYDGNSLCRLKTVETLYLYDLSANLEAVIAGLEGASFDLASVSATRVRLDDPDTGRSAEAIRFTDGAGRTCFALFEQTGVVFSEQFPFSTEA